MFQQSMKCKRTPLSAEKRYSSQENTKNTQYCFQKSFEQYCSKQNLEMHAHNISTNQVQPVCISDFRYAPHIMGIHGYKSTSFKANWSPTVLIENNRCSWCDQTHYQQQFKPRPDIEEYVPVGHKAHCWELVHCIRIPPDNPTSHPFTEYPPSAEFRTSSNPAAPPPSWLVQYAAPSPTIMKSTPHGYDPITSWLTALSLARIQLVGKYKTSDWQPSPVADGAVPSRAANEVPE